VSQHSADEHLDQHVDQHDDEYDAPEPVGPAPLEIHRNGLLAAGIGVVAGLVALAYLTRAVGGGSWLDWALTLLMGGVSAAYLATYSGSRTPILVADTQGIRLRLGRTWRGVPWESIERVEHEPRHGLLRDGRLVLVTEHPEALLADLDPSGRRQVALTRRLHGSPFVVPLSISTVVSGAEGDLTAALTVLADDPAQVVELVEEQYDEPDDQPYDQLEDQPYDQLADETPAHPVLHDPRPTLARGLDFLADRLRLHREEPDRPEEHDGRDAPMPTMPIVASATPLPLRDPVGGSRVEVRFEGAAALKTDPADDEHTAWHELPEAQELRRASDADDFDDAEETVVWSDRVLPIARPGQPVEPLVIDDVDVEPAAEPVIGPELAAARTRLGLTVDELAERTRIRPHVIESIEVDDFAPCGGDFYARGHLRTLARVLGVPAPPLVEVYDERYSDAPIDARRVFEAELATAAEGPIRSTRGGPNWSVLIAAVMALVLAWSIARLIMDSPVELHTKPVLNGSPSAQGARATPVPVLLDAATGGAHVVVRDGGGEVVFSGNLSYGEQKQVKAAPPVRVQSSDGALQVTVDGQVRGPLGAAGQPAQNTFAADQS
jgi:cytoskeleton protein RodZ